MKKILLFGAGKIGRSFIAQLFSKSGFETVFIDIDPKLIEALNTRGQYPVIIKSNENEQIINVTNVRAILVTKQEAVESEIIDADIIAVSVGVHVLPSIIPILTRGIIKRYQANPNWPIDIIIAENLRNAAEFMRNRIQNLTTAKFPIEDYIGLVETSIGKMVPFLSEDDKEKDILQVFAEPYNDLILDKKAFKNGVPKVVGLTPKENMKPWVDRKLFIHNLGHSATAYIGFLYNREFKYIYEVLAVNEIRSLVRCIMLEAANILLEMYPEEFKLSDLVDHIDDLISRFRNEALKDTIDRVGRDLERKLGPNDRIVTPIKAGVKLGLPIDNILFVLVCGTHFRSIGDDGSFIESDKNNIDYILTNVCGFSLNVNKTIFQKANEYFNEINNKQVLSLNCS